MKSEIFSAAINNRNKVKFLYGLDEVVIDPYYIGKDGNGKKYLYGRLSYSKEVRRFEYLRIANIKILNGNRFSPIIPILVN